MTACHLRRTAADAAPEGANKRGPSPARRDTAHSGEAAL